MKEKQGNVSVFQRWRWFNVVWRLSQEITFVLFTKKKDKLNFRLFFIISKQILSRAFEAICLIWRKPSFIQPEYFTLFHLCVIFICTFLLLQREEKLKIYGILLKARSNFAPSGFSQLVFHIQNKVSLVARLPPGDSVLMPPAFTSRPPRSASPNEPSLRHRKPKGVTQAVKTRTRWADPETHKKKKVHPA